MGKWELDSILGMGTGSHTVKESEIWDSGLLVYHVLGTFDLVVFKVILRSFSALYQNDL